MWWKSTAVHFVCQSEPHSTTTHNGKGYPCRYPVTLIRFKKTTVPVKIFQDQCGVYVCACVQCLYMCVCVLTTVFAWACLARVSRMTEDTEWACARVDRRSWTLKTRDKVSRQAVKLATESINFTSATTEGALLPSREKNAHRKEDMWPYECWDSTDAIAAWCRDADVQITQCSGTFVYLLHLHRYLKACWFCYSALNLSIKSSYVHSSAAFLSLNCVQMFKEFKGNPTHPSFAGCCSIR